MEFEYLSDEKKDETKPDVIIYVEVEPAHVSDAHALIPALESTQERHCEPETVLADSLYGSDENIEAAQQHVALPDRSCYNSTEKKCPYFVIIQ